MPAPSSLLRAPALRLALAFAGAALPAAAQDVAPPPAAPPSAPELDAVARVELLAEPSACVVGQAVELRLRVTLDEAFLRESAVPLYRRAMDLPVQVEAPWWAAPPGTLVLDAPAPPAAARRTLALGDDVVPAFLLDAAAVDGAGAGGAPRVMVELRRRVLPRFPGPLTLPAPVLHFAYATSFRDDLVQGRVAEDRHVAQVAGAPLLLDVRPLPEEGRPAGFSGAVGRFTVEASLTPEAPRVGEACVLALRLDGEGNLGVFDAPRLPPLDGLRSLGTLSDDAGPPRTIRYALVPERADVDGVGPIPFAFYDPEAGAYRTVQTARLPLRVTGVAPGVSPGDAAPGDAAAGTPSQGTTSATTSQGTTSGGPRAEAQGDTHGAHDAHGVSGGDGGSRAWIAGLAIVVLGALVLATVRSWRRASSSDAAPADDGALARLRAATAGGGDATQALVAYLAERLGCPASEIAGPGLRVRLRAAGLDDARADAVAERVLGLLAARYGGQGGATAATDVLALAEAVEAAHRARA